MLLMKVEIFENLGKSSMDVSCTSADFEKQLDLWITNYRSFKADIYVSDMNINQEKPSMQM